MRFVRYQIDSAVSYGILEGEEIEIITGSPLGSYTRTGQRRPLSSVKLLIPFEPGVFYAAGLNYADHVRVVDPILGITEANLPTVAHIGYRANNALIAHDEPIVKPSDSTERFQYEGELVAVIGKQAKNLSEDEALSCVFGYTIGNDVSERTWQANDSTLWRAKNSDTFKPMGPWIETDVDLEKLQTTVRLNGRVASDFPTNNMIFGVAHYISAMTRYLTLYPGDMIWMGTDGATENMKPGDVVEVEISGVGTLRNPVVAET